MKTIEEIEKLSLDDLERISLDESVPVPQGLEEMIVLPTREVNRRLVFRFVSIAASLVLLVGLAVTFRPKPLKDTFDDPALAYAEVQKALLKVSGGVGTGVNSVVKSGEILRKPAEIMHSINLENIDNE